MTQHRPPGGPTTAERWWTAATAAGLAVASTGSLLLDESDPARAQAPHVLALALAVGAVVTLLWAVRRTPPPAPAPVSRERPWWVDDVRPGVDDDEFGRADFVRRACALLHEISTDPTSVVLGLVGPWGSGKSSTLRWVTDSLDPARWKVTTTGAWAAAGPDGVVLELLRVLNGALDVGPELQRRRRFRRLARAASSTVTAVAPAVEQVPVIGPALSRVGWGALLPSATDPPLHQQIEQLEDLAAQSTTSTLVVVDDVDRLHPEELLALFRAVRVLGRLSHVHYLLVYDEQTLLRLLRTTAVAGGDDERHAADFLEKVVTLPLTQPPAAREDVERLLLHRLREAMASTGVEVTAGQELRLATEVGAFFAELVTTPRAVVRFAAQLHSYLPLVRPEDVDVIDFAVLTLLRLRFSRLYDALARDSWALVTRHPDAGREERYRWSAPRVLGALSVPEDERASVFDALRRLFPFGVATNPDDVMTTARRQTHEDAPRVSDADFTDLYFSLVAPAAGGDDALARRAVDELVAGAVGEGWTALTEAVVVGARLEEQSTSSRAEAAASRRASRLLRRASHLHGSRAAVPDSRVLGVLLDLRMELGGPEASTGPRAAVSHWVAVAVDEPSPLPVAAAVDAVVSDRRVGTPSERLLRLVAVLEDRRWERADLTELRARLADTAWSLALAAPRDARDSPVELLRAVDRLAPHRLDVLLLEALDAGPPTTLVDLVARWWGGAPISGEHAGGCAWLPALVRIAGPERVRAELARTPATSDGDGDTHQAAREALQRVVADRGNRSARLPRGLDVADDTPLLPLPQLLDRSVAGLRDPDIGFVLSARIPAPAGTDSAGASATTWETVVSSLGEGSAAAQWLATTAPAWRGVPSRWRRLTDEPGVVSVIAASLAARTPGAQAPAHAPVQLAAQVARIHSGSAAGAPGLRVVVELGAWLRDVDEDRRASRSSSRTTPLPAPRSLQEVEEAVSAGVQWLFDAVAAARPLLSEAERRSVVLVDCRSTGARPWRVVRFAEEVPRREGAPERQLEQQLALAPTALPLVRDQAPRIARQLLHEWLVRAGAEDDDRLPW